MAGSRGDTNRCMILELPTELRLYIFRHLLKSCEFDNRVTIIVTQQDEYMDDGYCHRGDYVLDSFYWGKVDTAGIFSVCRQFHVEDDLCCVPDEHADLGYLH